MSASNPHRRFSPVRACVLLIVVYLAVCAALFADDVRLSTPGEFRQLFPTLFAEEPPSTPDKRNSSASTLFADKLPHERHPSFAPAEEIRGRAQRTQRTQRGGDDRVQAFYDGAEWPKVQQKRDAERMSRYRRSHPSHRYGSAAPRFAGPHAGHRL
jgi:hypothetical protein